MGGSGGAELVMFVIGTFEGICSYLIDYFVVVIR